jgi:hypothetical protein
VKASAQHTAGGPEISSPEMSSQSAPTLTEEAEEVVATPEGAARVLDPGASVRPNGG